MTKLDCAKVAYLFSNHQCQTANKLHTESFVFNIISSQVHQMQDWKLGHTQGWNKLDSENETQTVKGRNRCNIQKKDAKVREGRTEDSYVFYSRIETKF